MSKIIDFIEEVMEYIANHWGAIFITVIALSIGLLNPFVVEKFQTIYSYPVTKTDAIAWDIVYISMILIVVKIENRIKTLETDK